MGATYQFCYHLSRYLARTFFNYRVVNGERIIEEGGVILAMNHESYLDPPLAGIACRREIYYLARKTLLDWPVLGPIFPEGSRTWDGQLQPAQPGLGLIIAKTDVPVIPMRIFGAHHAFPRGGKPRLFTPITLVIGEPMYFGKADRTGEGRELYQRLSEQVMARIAQLTLPDS